MGNGYSHAGDVSEGPHRQHHPLRSELLAPAVHLLAVGPGRNFPFALGFPDYKVGKSGSEGRRLSPKRKWNRGPWVPPPALIVMVLQWAGSKR